MNYLLKRLKQEYSYLKASDSTSFLVVNHNLAQAFKMLFKHQGGYPHFKSRHASRQAYTGRSTCQVLAKRRVRLPKLGSVRTSKTNQLNSGKIKRYTVSSEPTGRYYLSLQVEVEAPQALPKTGLTVGLDVGVADLAISSDGIKYGTFHARWAEKQATKWQSKYAKRKHQATIAVRQWNHNHKTIKEELNDYQNWQRAQQQKARYQVTVANQRKDYLHKLTTNGNWDQVTSPTIDGYIASQSEVPAQQVTANDHSQGITITYNLQHVDPEIGEVTVNYLDQDENNRVISSKRLYGAVGSNTNYSTKPEIDQLLSQHYILASDPTNGTDLVITSAAQTYNIYFKHGQKALQDTKTVTETIHYQYADGTQAAPDHVATITFTRNGVHDEVTGNDTWDPWSAADQTFAAVDSPVIAGYTANPAVVTSQKVTAADGNQVITVTYTKNAASSDQHPTSQQPSSQQPSSQQPSNPQSGNQPASTPTQQPSASQAEQPGAVGQQVPAEAVNVQPVHNNGPIGYKWETVRVLVPNSPAQGQQRLPQTGSAHQQMGFVLTLMASILGIFGLSLGFKKDQHN